MVLPELSLERMESLSSLVTACIAAGVGEWVSGWVWVGVWATTYKAGLLFDIIYRHHFRTQKIPLATQHCEELVNFYKKVGTGRPRGVV